MTRSLLYRLVIFLPIAVSAQYEHHLELPRERIGMGDVQVTFLTGISKFVTAQNRFLESTAGIRFGAGPWEFSTSIRLNNQIDFEIPADGSFLNLAEHETVFIDPNFSLKNESYQISKPFTFSVSRQFGMFRTSFDLSPVIRSERLWTPLVERIDSTTYTISSYEDSREQADLIGGFLAETSIEPFTLIAGLSSISFGRVGDARIPAAKLQTVLGAGYFGGSYRSDLLWNGNDIYLQYRQSFQFPWIELQEPSMITLRGNVNTQRYESAAFSLLFEVPVSARMELIAGYAYVRTPRNRFSRSDLQRWYSSIAPPWDDDLESRLPHTSIKVGVQYDLRKERTNSDIQLLHSSFTQRDIYFSKRDFYAYNPVGRITVRNTSREIAESQFVLQIEGGLGVYRSGLIRLQPDESKEIPLFLYLADVSIQQPSASAELELTMIESGKDWTLAAVPVTIHEAHHWDGDTRNLHFFLTPEDPAVIEHARKILITTADRDTNKSEFQRMFQSLKGFINNIGKELHYVSDPTTTVVVDRVQYPKETLEARAGDCEDLVVYTASYLMAIGYQCAVVDIMPQRKNGDLDAVPGKPGHVFLLVDTGIESERAKELDLVDVQWVARRSSNGPATIWIPLETTVLSKGFEEAFRNGVVQYYENVLAPDAFSAHSVNVIDF